MRYVVIDNPDSRMPKPVVLMEYRRRDFGYDTGDGVWELADVEWPEGWEVLEVFSEGDTWDRIIIEDGDVLHIVKCDIHALDHDGRELEYGDEWYAVMRRETVQ